jgi:hypothetical protein
VTEAKIHQKKVVMVVMKEREEVGDFFFIWLINIDHKTNRCVIFGSSNRKELEKMTIFK